MKSPPPAGRPATPREYKHPVPASDRLLDEAITFLAALRMGLEPPEMQVPARVVEAFLIDRPDNGRSSQPTRANQILPGNAAAAGAHSADPGLAGKPTFNELRLVPGLVCEGEWTNQPLDTRAFLLRLLEALPKGKWWSLPAFIQAVKENYPDFQRPAGDYNSWFIKRKIDGEYLRGFATWNEVDGALIHYLITGPMFWLGLVELATPEDNENISAFRINEKQAIEQRERQVGSIIQWAH